MFRNNDLMEICYDNEPLNSGEYLIRDEDSTKRLSKKDSEQLEAILMFQ